MPFGQITTKASAKLQICTNCCWSWTLGTIASYQSHRRAQLWNPRQTSCIGYNMHRISVYHTCVTKLIRLWNEVCNHQRDKPNAFVRAILATERLANAILMPWIHICGDDKCYTMLARHANPSIFGRCSLALNAASFCCPLLELEIGAWLIVSPKVSHELKA